MPVGKARKRNKVLPSGASFARRVLEIVRRIPRGKVLTYGQVAVLAGVPRASRIVGGVLYQLGPDSRLPWHRVINREGGISTYRVGSGDRQRELLENEGVDFSRRGRLELKKYQWLPPLHLLKSWELPDHVAFDLQRRFKL